MQGLIDCIVVTPISCRVATTSPLVIVLLIMHAYV